MQQQRQRLPASEARPDLLKAVAHNQVIVISGETGVILQMHLFHDIMCVVWLLPGGAPCHQPMTTVGSCYFVQLIWKWAIEDSNGASDCRSLIGRPQSIARPKSISQAGCLALTFLWPIVSCISRHLHVLCEASCDLDGLLDGT